MALNGTTQSQTLTTPLLCAPTPTTGARYKRYRLSDGKDFDSLFFPEKEALLRVLEHFENKSGEKMTYFPVSTNPPRASSIATSYIPDKAPHRR